MYYIEEVTADVFAGQNKLSEQKIALHAVCMHTSRDQGLKIPPHIS